MAAEWLLEMWRAQRMGVSSVSKLLLILGCPLLYEIL